MLKVDYRKEIDHIYYNGTLFNSSFTNSIPAQINDVLNAEIIQKGSDYDVTVIRIGVSGHALPIFNIYNNLLSVKNKLPVVPPYLTDYTVSISLNGNTQTNNVEFIPITTDLNTLFNIYTYQSFLDMINAAYDRCFIDWGTNYGGALAALVNQAPYLYYDGSTNLITLYAESRYNTININPIGVYMNHLLFDFFDSLEYYELSKYNAANGTDIQLNIQARTCLNISPLGPGYPARLSAWSINAGQTIWALCQQYPSVYSWNIVRSLILVSSLGTNSENIPISGGANLNLSNSSITALTDFDSNFNENNNIGSRGYLQYFPTAEYRLVNITNTSKIQQITLGVYYIDFTGKLAPLLLDPRFSMSIKLLFRKKDFRLLK